MNWMSVHDVLTEQEWEAMQPKPEQSDRWDVWYSCYALKPAWELGELSGVNE